MNLIINHIPNCSNANRMDPLKYRGAMDTYCAVSKGGLRGSQTIYARLTVKRWNGQKEKSINPAHDHFLAFHA